MGRTGIHMYMCISVLFGLALYVSGISFEFGDTRVDAISGLVWFAKFHEACGNPTFSGLVIGKIGFM